MGLGFITGKNSLLAAKAEKERQAQRQEEYNKAWRFWLEPEEEAQVVFVDGALGEDGHLVPDRYYEHQIFDDHSKRMHYFFCPEKTHPETGQKCPICEEKNRWASLVSLFTIIDLRMYTPKTGAPRMNGRRLYIPKQTGFEIVNSYAGKRGGLVGWKVDIKRSGEKASRTGDIFDFVEKRPVAEWQKMFQEDVLDPATKKPTGKKQTMFSVIDYKKEITQYTEDELRRRGFGAQAVAGVPRTLNLDGAATDTGSPASAPVPDSADTAGGIDYEEVL